MQTPAHGLDAPPSLSALASQGVPVGAPGFAGGSTQTALLGSQTRPGHWPSLLHVGRQSSTPSATLAQRTSGRPRHLGAPASASVPASPPASVPASVPGGGPMVQEGVQRPGWLDTAE